MPEASSDPPPSARAIIRHMPAFEPVIGLEVHVELLTRTKMFCACPVVDPSGAEPNRAVCEVCMGLPGTLPVLNQHAV